MSKMYKVVTVDTNDIKGEWNYIELEFWDAIKAIGINSN